MAESSIDIQRIVREVLAELGGFPKKPPLPLGEGRGEGVAIAAESPNPIPEGEGTYRVSADNNRELVVTARVVTTAQIGDRLSGVRRLVVAPHAIITPSVHDALRNNNVALVYATAPPDAGVANVRLVVGTLGASFDPTGLIGALRDEGIDIEPRGSDCVIEMSGELAGELTKGSTLAVMLTSRPAIAMCVANRLPGVRAVLATDPPATAKATDSIGANLLVIAPRTVSFFLLKQLIRDFHQSGIRECPEPEQLRKHLA